MPRPTSQQRSPKTNADKPGRWPYKAAGVLDDTLIRLADIEGYEQKIDRQHKDIDDLALIGLTAAKTGNHDLVRQAFNDIRNATINTRHYCVDIRGRVAASQKALNDARDGRYEG